MAIAKVILNGVTQMDVTQKTVTAGSMLSGATALKNDGTDITGSITSQAAQTIHPSRSDQIIASGKYLTGTQTIKAVATTNLSAENIVSGVTVKVGDSTDDDCVASVTGTAATGGNDFVIAIELSTSSGKYEPYECTFETALAAYNAGKHIAFVLEQSAGNPVPCAGAYYPSYNAFGYGIRIDASGSNWTGVEEEKYMWTSSGITKVSTADYYSTSNATALPADVASGKVFYNASGYQTGTASGGGGGLDASYKAVIQRDNADITLPNDLTKVGNYAFYDGRNLRITSLPSGITTIGDYAFGFTAINVSSLPNGVTSIGRNAFYGCANLALTSLPSGITTIPQYCFYDCTRVALTSLPSGVTSIGQYAFYNCTSLALTSLPSGISTVSVDAFYNCYAVTISSLPDAVTYIGAYAFRGCESMTGISGNGAITTLGSNAFYGVAGHLSQLEYARFPNMVISSLGTVFGSSTETNACQELELADIGSTAAIAADAFRRCYKLQTLILRKSDAICTLANTSAFTSTPIRGYNGLTGTIYVPSALISTYQTATNWATVYAEGYVTFAAIEGSQYEL